MSEATTEPLIQHNTFTFLVSRDMLIAEGHIDPTDEERAAEHVRRVERWHTDVAEWKVYDAARDALAAIEEPLSRALLDLHSSETVEHPECKGCDWSGPDGEPPEWPCRTVEAIAKGHGIALPDQWSIYSRPEPAPPTLEQVWPPGRKPFRVRDLFPQSFTSLDPIVFGVEP